LSSVNIWDTDLTEVTDFFREIRKDIR
jgi:hypothetical protein